MTDIFISYRRSNAFVVDHLHDKLSSHFAKGSIFLDRADIVPGAPFPEALRAGVTGATIVLAVIGQDWISVQDERTFRRRIEIADDWVREELKLALSGSGVTIPVLVDGARMPTAEQLPDDLQGLATLQSIVLSRERFRDDVDKLIGEIEKRLGKERTSRLLKEGGNPYPKAANFKPIVLEGEQLDLMMSELPYWKVVESEIHDDPRYGTGYKRVEIVRDF